VFDFIIEKGIGANFASTYERISQHCEYELMDFKLADKILRIGMTKLKDNEK